MTTKTIDLQTMPVTLDTLLKMLDEDTEILLVEGEKPVARLSSATGAKGRIAGLHAGTTWVSDDFDEPLSDAFWSGEE
jgi:hypothetical protein